MNKKVCVIVTVLCLLPGLPSFLEAQTADNAVKPRSVRLPWPKDDSAWRYEVVIEAETRGEYRKYLQEFTQQFFIIVSLPPGRYRYRVIPYNFLGRPEIEQSSAWRSFEIPAFAPAPTTDGKNDSPEPEELIFIPVFEEPEEPVIPPESGDSTARPESEEEPTVPDDGLLGNPANLWTAGVSLGTSFYRPWIIATLHATFAPLPYSFLEAGIDLGLISGDTDLQYYSLYPFAHYAYFRPFPETAGRQAGGWYIGAGGGFWISRGNSWAGDAEDDKFIADFIAGLNLINMFDISYTLRTDFKGLNHKFSVGYVYRFKVLGTGD